MPRAAQFCRELNTVEDRYSVTTVNEAPNPCNTNEFSSVQLAARVQSSLGGDSDVLDSTRVERSRQQACRRDNRTGARYGVAAALPPLEPGLLFRCAGRKAPQPELRPGASVCGCDVP